MSLLAAALLAGGVLVGSILARRATARRGPRDGLPSSSSRRHDEAQVSVVESGRAWIPAGLGLSLGDVLVRAGGEEAWLSNALVLSEDRPTAVLFFAPEVGGDRVVYARVDAGGTPWWLSPVKTAVPLPEGDPPPSLELDARHFQRIRRVPVALRGVGKEPPSVGATAVLGEYSDGVRGRLVLLVTPRKAHAYVGEELAPGLHDVFPGGAR